MRQPWYDDPTAWAGWCRAVTSWQPQEKDYDQAMRNELPEKWWQFYQKLM